MCPSICPHFTHWAYCDRFSNVPINSLTKWSLVHCDRFCNVTINSITICPAITFWSNSKELCNLSTKCLSHSLRFLSKCTLQFDHNMPSGYFAINSPWTHHVCQELIFETFSFSYFPNLSHSFPLFSFASNMVTTLTTPRRGQDIVFYTLKRSKHNKWT